MDRLSKCLKLFFGLNLENKEHALRGWNWGKADFGRGELAFNVQNRPAFEVPYSEISNTNLAGKNEVSVELSLPADDKETGTNDLGGARGKGYKAGGARDQLTEIRFYVPGTATTKKGKEEDQENGEAESGEEGEIEEQNAASLFYETLMEKADIGEVAGDTYATFPDVLHLTPRGRFDVDMYEKSFRMRGKTYDYKVLYESIKKFMVLPKPDDLHTLICIGLDPPLRQGQTRYPFIVMQFKREEEVELDLNMTQEMIDEKYKGKLQAHYEQKQHSIVAHIFKGLAGKKISLPSKDFISHHQQSGVKCSVKASEGYLFCLEKSFMFVPKPAQYIPFENVSIIVLSRIGGALAASRTFDVTITLKSGLGEHQFSNINREEQKPLEDFFDAKQLIVRNEMLDDVSHRPLKLNAWRQANLLHRETPSSPRPSRTRTWRRRTRRWWRARTAAAPTRTRRASTRTSRPTPSRTWPRSSTRTTSAAGAGATRTRRWRTRRARRARARRR